MYCGGKWGIMNDNEDILLWSRTLLLSMFRYVSTAGCPTIVSRSEWGARAPTSISYISQPIPRVFIHHTETSSCTTKSACISIVKSIQNYHMDSNGMMS
jgi:hypothetical protein